LVFVEKKIFGELLRDGRAALDRAGRDVFVNDARDAIRVNADVIVKTIILDGYQGVLDRFSECPVLL
jgi:hypothetical protein